MIVNTDSVSPSPIVNPQNNIYMIFNHSMYMCEDSLYHYFLYPSLSSSSPPSPFPTLTPCSEHEIHGRHLLELNQEDLKDMGIK